MSAPIVFISHFRIKGGKPESVTRLIQEVADGLEADKPRTVAFLVYSDEAGNKATFVHVFGDAQAMDSHFEGADQRASAAYEFIEPEGGEIYGSPSDRALEAMRREATAAGVPLRVEPHHVAGFLRLAPG